MKRYISTRFVSTLVVLFTLGLLAGCESGLGAGGDTSRSDAGDLHDVRLTVNLIGNNPQEFALQDASFGFIERVEATLFQNGSPAFTSEVLVAQEAHVAELVFTAVPSGTYRLVLRGFDSDDQVLSESATDLVVLPGQTTSLTLFLEAGSIITPGPVARDDAYTNVPGTTLAVGAASGVLSNDTSDGGTVSLVTAPTQGSLELEPDGSFSYTSNLTATGNDSFVYRLSDSTGTDQATVTITFTEVTTENLAYIYVANPTPNLGGGSVSVIAVALDGTLSQVVIEPNAGRPLGIAKTPDERFLYTVNVITGTLVSYEVDAQTGLLSRIGEEFAELTGSLQKMAIHPSQRFAYVNDATGNVAGLLVGSDGALAVNPNSPLLPGMSSGGRSIAPTFNASGDRMYTANRNADSINVQQIDLDTGELSFVDPLNPNVPTDPGDIPHFTLLSRDGNFLYVANLGSDSVSTFAFTANGSLTQVSKRTIPNFTPRTMALHPTLPILYVAGDGGGGVLVPLTTEDDGSLTPFGESVAIAPIARGLVVEHTGQFIYAVIAAEPYQIDALSISPEGGLTFLDTYTGMGLSFPSDAVIIPAQ